jgi:hypothetical protein
MFNPLAKIIIKLLILCILYFLFCLLAFIVQKNSDKCKLLSNLNINYKNYHLDNRENFQYKVSSLSQFRNFNYYKRLKEILEYDLEYRIWMIDFIKLCKSKSLEYENVYGKILIQNPTASSNLFVLPRIFTFIEKQILRNMKMKFTINLKIVVQASYMSPGGRNYYCHKKEFGFLEIVQMLEKIEFAAASMLQNERSKMTPSLRYKILQRDNFRCCCCGVSAKDGAILEIDHIVPVSKGGKTEESNLQTLCRTCNRGKSNKIYNNQTYY